MCWPRTTSIAPLASTMPEWQRLQSVLCGCGSGGGARGRSRSPSDPPRRPSTSASGSASAPSVAPWQYVELQLVPSSSGGCPARRGPRTGARSSSVDMVRLVTGVAIAARERLADRTVHDVLLVRPDGALRGGERLALRPHGRRRVHSLGAVTNGAAAGQGPARSRRCAGRRRRRSRRSRGRCPRGSGCSSCSAGAASGAKP